MGFKQSFKILSSQLEGELYDDSLTRKIYATDASAYRELPEAVAFPKTESDIAQLISFARAHKTSLIPRTAGTSLAGQVVGSGIVVDVSKYFTKILEVNTNENWVRVQPGVIRDILNMELFPHGLMFGPETSTANRAMIGGMIGNNSCGSNSVVFGSTRDHMLDVSGFLSDGSKVHFKKVSQGQFELIKGNSSLETLIYSGTIDLLRDSQQRNEILQEFPKPSIPRRNTGYAVDLLLPMINADGTVNDLNMCKLIAGSEGTLMFVTEAKLNLEPLPPEYGVLVCSHFDSIYESLRATLVASRFSPNAVELIDHFILDCTKQNIEQRKNRFFVEGDPKAILITELRRNSEKEVRKACTDLVSQLKEAGLGYSHPIVEDSEAPKIWALRKAGLGLLSNIPGDAKPVPVVEDTAVDLDDLPEFIREFDQIMLDKGLECVHYAHAGSGELHLRPILNLKTKEGNELFRTVAEDIARLVKKFNGSLSGEHGDGRLRGEFIPQMIGESNYRLLKSIKKLWDPDNIFNPGKIVDTPSMNSSLRYEPDQVTTDIETMLSFDDTKGIQRAAEMCNGSGDCRKSFRSGGTMCPSYMATNDEKHTTRARANLFREVITRTEKEKNPFDNEEILDVMDLCLSCKGCKSECPSNVDIAKIKAEFLYQYQKKNGLSMRTRLFGQATRINRMVSGFSGVYNSLMSGVTGTFAKKMIGVAPQRELPKIHKVNLRKWFVKRGNKPMNNGRTVALFCDEFTDFLDVELGKKVVGLIEKLGYNIEIPEHAESGRAPISKGMLEHARKLAIRNIESLFPFAEAGIPIIGIEPSAILTLRDEYLDLVPTDLKSKAELVSDSTMLIDEFLDKEIIGGSITADAFNNSYKRILLHGHCHQKALSSTLSTKSILSLPRNYEVEEIRSGCCGMAGSFGYEIEHYDISMQIGELVLFPAVRESEVDTLIAATGTSCRHQIMDGTNRKSFHPAEILHDALI